MFDSVNFLPHFAKIPVKESPKTQSQNSKIAYVAAAAISIVSGLTVTTLAIRDLRTKGKNGSEDVCDNVDIRVSPETVNEGDRLNDDPLRTPSPLSPETSANLHRSNTQFDSNSVSSRSFSRDGMSRLSFGSRDSFFDLENSDHWKPVNLRSLPSTKSSRASR